MQCTQRRNEHGSDLFKGDSGCTSQFAELVTVRVRHDRNMNVVRRSIPEKLL